MESRGVLPRKAQLKISEIYPYPKLVCVLRGTIGSSCLSQLSEEKSLSGNHSCRCSFASVIEVSYQTIQTSQKQPYGDGTILTCALTRDRWFRC